MKGIVFALTLLAGSLAACENDADLIHDPRPGDIYILEDEGIYYPMKLDSIAELPDEIYMVNSKFVFTDAIPGAADLPDHEFDYTFHLIYKKDELLRLYDKGSIVEIYRD